MVSGRIKTWSIQDAVEMGLKGIVYYTDNKCDERIAEAVRNRLIEIGYPIVSVSHKPLPDFGLNILLDMEPSIVVMFMQILIGLEASKSDVIFLAEHDVLYHPTHFSFVPPEKTVFYYNVNTWVINAKTGKGIFHNQPQASGLCAYKSLLIDHYRECVKSTGYIGFEPGITRGITNYKAETWMSECPNIDIRHANNLTSGRFMELTND